jgi:hypothetical protein
VPGTYPVTDWDLAEPYLWAGERLGWTKEQVDNDPPWLWHRRRLYAALYDQERRRRGL